ncbi:hypothetical protein [Solidesulfovibrio alcoholivorans]|uniref:hypothetical protein n=1 Tax=Solidesulfovibrio alcoholivorans TaxID=81406 RepID=UPI0012EBB3C3|nr:hypothetical protein [Solidesulfovibrio alcoholivorans]
MGSVVIKYKPKAQRQKDALSKKLRPILDALEQHLLETAGKPYGRGWDSLGPLPELDGKMHCHLNFKNVAIWDIQEKSSKGSTETTILVEYVGKRDNAYKNKK